MGAEGSNGRCVTFAWPLRASHQVVRDRASAGVTVVATRYNGMIRDFRSLNVLSGVPSTRAELHQASEELKSRLR